MAINNNKIYTDVNYTRTYKICALINKLTNTNPSGPPLWSSGQSFWLGSFLGPTKLSEKEGVWNGVHSAS
jgi:hypothetical protein